MTAERQSDMVVGSFVEAQVRSLPYVRSIGTGLRFSGVALVCLSAALLAVVWAGWAPGATGVLVAFFAGLILLMTGVAIRSVVVSTAVVGVLMSEKKTRRAQNAYDDEYAPYGDETFVPGDDGAVV